MVADKLAAAKVPVLIGAMNNIPTTFNALGQRQENAALLRAAGVTVAHHRQQRRRRRGAVQHP